MTYDTYAARRAAHEQKMFDAARAIATLDDAYLTSIGAHPLGFIVDVIEGETGRKPRRLTMRIIDRKVVLGKAHYVLSSDIEEHGGRHVTRNVPHERTTPTEKPFP